MPLCGSLLGEMFCGAKHSLIPANVGFVDLLDCGVLVGRGTVVRISMSAGSVAGLKRSIVKAVSTPAAQPSSRTRWPASRRIAGRSYSAFGGLCSESVA